MPALLFCSAYRMPSDKDGPPGDSLGVGVAAPRGRTNLLQASASAEPATSRARRSKRDQTPPKGLPRQDASLPALGTSVLGHAPRLHPGGSGTAMMHLDMSKGEGGRGKHPLEGRGRLRKQRSETTPPQGSCATVPELWNRREGSDGYLVTLREARRSRQIPNASLYQPRQRAHRGAARRSNNGRHGRRRKNYIDTMPETLIGAVAPAGPL